MKLPDKVEMELTTAHPYIPGGYLFFWMSEKAQKKSMQKPNMHYAWESPFYEVNDGINLQIRLDVEQYAKSSLGSRLANDITAELVIFPNDQSRMTDIAKNKSFVYNAAFNYALCHINGLKKLGKMSQCIGIKNYKDGKSCGTEISNSLQDELKQRINIPPAIPLYFLDKAQHKVSLYSKEERIDALETKSFYTNRAIALSRLRKIAGRNYDLSQLADNIFRNQ